MDALGGNCYEYVRRFSEWRYELKLSYHTVVRETWWLHIDDPAIEFKYFLKGEALEALEGIREHAQPLLDVLEGAAQPLLELLERAAEAGKEWAVGILAQITEMWGEYSGLTASKRGGEVEMVDMSVEHNRSD